MVWAVRSQKRCLRREIAWWRQPAILSTLPSLRRDTLRRFVLWLDVTNETQAKAAFESAIASFGVLDVLVNNAGYGYVRPVEDTSLADFSAQNHACADRRISDR